MFVVNVNIRWILSFVVGALLGLVSSTSFAQSASDKADGDLSLWTKPPFGATPQELLQDATISPNENSDAAFEVLLDEGIYSIDERGRRTSATRLIYQIRDRDSVSSYGNMQKTWEPWHQQRPEFKARVITPDGSVHEFDPKTVEELRIPSENPQIFSDRVLLRAPLPALTDGAVVEYQITVRETKPRFKSGRSVIYLIGSFAPSRKLHVEVTAPESTPLSYRILGPKVDSLEIDASQANRLVIDAWQLPPLERGEDNLPHDKLSIPTLIASTGQSWSDCANEYAKLVATQLSDIDLQATTLNAIGDAQDRNEQIKHILTNVRQRVRYTGIEFGDAGIIPRTPAETLDRGYGDCKDQATLTVAMLRSIGIDASVALLRTGPTFDVPKDLPSLEFFNHAIVHVPADPTIQEGDETSLELWIDPTATHCALGELPSACQGRSALIATPSTNQLVEIPRLDSSHNQIQSRETYTLMDDGNVQLDIHLQRHGEFARSARAFFATATLQEAERLHQQMGTQLYGTDQLVSLDYSSSEDLDPAFVLNRSYHNPSVAGFVDGGAIVLLYPGSVLTHLPDSFLATTSTDAAGNEADGKRKQPLQTATPFRHELQCDIVVPDGYDLTELPEEQSIRVGPATFEMTFRQDTPQAVTATFMLDVGDGYFTAKEVNLFRQRLQEVSSQESLEGWELPIQFEHRASNLFNTGNTLQGVREFVRLAKANPESVAHAIDLTEVLTQLGLTAAAVDSAKHAIEIAPDNSLTHNALGFALSYNSLGQHLSRGYDRPAAIAAFRQALQIDPNFTTARMQLGQLLARTDEAFYPADDTELKEAVSELTAVNQTLQDELLLDQIVTALYHLEPVDKDAIDRLLKAAAPSSVRQIHSMTLAAVRDGVEQAQQLIDRENRDPASRRTAIAQLIATLDLLRYYELAETLAKKSIDVTATQAERSMAEMLSVRRRAGVDQFDVSDPVGAARKFTADVLLYGELSDELHQRFANPVTVDRDFPLRPALPKWFAIRRQQLAKPGISQDRIKDEVTVLTFDAEGTDEIGYRVRVKHKTIDGLSWDLFVVPQDGRFRVLRTGNLDAEIGKLALQQIELAKLEAAKKWLNWAWERERGKVGWFDPFSGSPFARVWSTGNHDQEKRLRFAALTLAAPGSHAAESIKPLVKVRDEATVIDRVQIDRALMLAYQQTLQTEKALKVATRLAEKQNSIEPHFHRYYFMTVLRQFDELRELADDTIPSDPKYAMLQQRAVMADLAEGKADSARARLQALSSLPNLATFQHSEMAWSCLLADQPEKALAHARIYAERADFEDMESLQIYALAFASTGQIAQATDALALAFNRFGCEHPRLNPLTQGRMAEACGLDETAIQLYRQVKPSPQSTPLSAYDFAQQRIKLLASE